MNQYSPTRPDLTSVGVPYKQSFVIDVSPYQDSSDTYEAALLHRTGLRIEQIFAMAFRLFNTYSPRRERGCPPPIIQTESLSTIVDSVQPFRRMIQNAHERAVHSNHCNLGYDQYKRMVNAHIIRMYLVCYPFFVNMYIGILQYYQTDGVILETINVTCSGNRIYFGVFNVL